MKKIILIPVFFYALFIAAAQTGSNIKVIASPHMKTLTEYSPAQGAKSLEVTNEMNSLKQSQQ